MRVVVGIVLFVVTLLVLFNLGAWITAAAGPHQAMIIAIATPAQLTDTGKRQGPQLGQQGHLFNPSGSTVAMATTADSLAEAVRAMAMKDSVGLSQLMNGGQFVQIASGTRVQIIDGAARLSIGMSKVRLLDGPSAGMAGWVLDNSISP